MTGVAAALVGVHNPLPATTKIQATAKMKVTVRWPTYDAISEAELCLVDYDDSALLKPYTNYNCGFL